jgi:ATP-dependent DNA helicase PIF1
MATNDEINEINSSELNKLNSPSQFYQAVDFEDKRYGGRLEELTRSCIAPERLELKIGVQVMLIKNLTDKLVNGCQGIVIGFQPKFDSKLKVENKQLPLVKFANGIEKVIQEAE